MPYLEERVEQLEKEVQKIKKLKKTEEYKSPQQFAEFMGITINHVRNLIARGEIKVIRLGECIRIPMSQIDEEQKEKKTSSMKEAIFGQEDYGKKNGTDTDRSIDMFDKHTYNSIVAGIIYGDRRYGMDRQIKKPLRSGNSVKGQRKTYKFIIAYTEVFENEIL